MIPFEIHPEWNVITRTIAPIVTVNWKAASGPQWTVPLGGASAKRASMEVRATSLEMSSVQPNA